MERRLTLNGSTVLGVFARVTEEIAVIPTGTPDTTLHRIEDTLDVISVQTGIAGSSVVGSLVSGNCNGFVVSRSIHQREIEVLREFGSVSQLPGTMTAAGNVILANDTAAIANPRLSDRAMKAISETLGVDARRATIADLDTVGMAGVATNKGVLVHPMASDAEIAVLEEVFDLPVGIGTVNLGSPLIGAGLLANSAGYLAGSDTTGHELGRIEDALGYV
ncbi:MAG: translation initiation factor IF-6 [Methanosarcinales archaeon]|nr:translation initiation factor IF-6 [Methanosarcinales archaeon]HDJ38004.1 translation initiation factor IF-6 [Methanosarcinales archaeon]